MKVTENNALKERFLERLRRRYDKPRTGIHVSSLLYCLKESYFRMTSPKPQTLKTLQFFTDGSARHDLIQNLLGVEYEVKKEKYGVVGHIDALLDKPLEFKSTRSQSIDQSSLPEHYITQLGFYCVLSGVNSGYLVIQRINAREGDPWLFYEISFSEEEMLNFDYELYNRANLLKTALEKKDLSILPPVNSSMRWKCASCNYRVECQKERRQETG